MPAMSRTRTTPADGVRSTIVAPNFSAARRMSSSAPNPLEVAELDCAEVDGHPLDVGVLDQGAGHLLGHDGAGRQVELARHPDGEDRGRIGDDLDVETRVHRPSPAWGRPL